MNQVSNDLKPLSIGDVLDYSVEALKQNFKGLLFISLVLFIPWIVFYTLTLNSVINNQVWNSLSIKGIFNESTLEYSYNYGQEDSSIGGMIFLVVYLLPIIYNLTIKLVSNASVIKMIYDYAISDRVTINSFSDALKLIKGCLRFLPKLMGSLVLFVIILISVYFAFSLAFGMILIIPIGMIIDSEMTTVAMGVVLSIFMLVIILAIFLAIGYFAVRLIFGANAIVIEGTSVFGSIKRSIYLTKGKFWHIAVTSIFAFLLYALFSLLLAGGSVMLLYVNKTAFIVFYTFSQLCTSLIEPFILIYITLLFISMKVRKEGLDLEIKMRKLIDADRNRMNNVDGETANA